MKKLNEKKFFELAKASGLESAELTIFDAKSLSISLYHGEVDSFKDENTFMLVARGIYDGKMGSVKVDNVNKETPEFLVKGIKRAASLIENDDPVFIFKGSPKYARAKLNNNVDFTENIQEKVGILKEIEKKLLAFDKRINEVVTVGYEASKTSLKKSNSYGLKLSRKKTPYTYFAEVTAKNGEEVRTGFDVFSSNEEGAFNVDKFVESVAKDALSKLGSVQCPSKKYPVVLNQECVATFISFLISSLDAEEVQKHTSLLEGKLGQQVFSKKLTVIENPVEKNMYFRSFDDEGVATKKKYLFNKGVVSTYLYTLRTAAKDNVEPTGNASGLGSKPSANVNYVVVKPGKKTEDEIISTIKEGVYLTELSGLHSGVNPQSGNFSVQCAGFMIRDGKKAKPLALITVADNLINVFKNIKAVSSNSKLITFKEMMCPSIYVGKLAISGK